MVATRRGVRVSPPTKANPEEAPEVQATSSTSRRTRASVKQADPSSPSQHTLVETCKHLEGEGPSSPSTSIKKRCSRAARLHSPEQQCTPVGSIHEGDVSDVESCCSVASNVELPVARSRSRRTRPRPLSQEDEVSEAESCSSARSASRPSQSSRRSTRRRPLPDSADVAPAEAAEVKEDPVLEAESRSSVPSESQRLTRNQRKAASTRSSIKQPSEESELSDAESCASTISGADASQTSTRRSTRSRRQIRPIPIHVDEFAESSQSPVPASRRTRAQRGKAAAAADGSEPPSCDSEGFESGPTRRSLRTRTAALRVIDSDSEVTDVHSSVGSRGTPCSSRTGSGNSSRSAPATRSSMKGVSVVLERAVEVAEEDSSMNDDRLDSTVVGQDADCTLLEGDDKQICEEQEGATATDVTPSAADTKTEEVIVISEDSSHVSDSPRCATEAGNEPAVISKDQQEEPPAEDKAGDATEMEMMQEAVPSLEPPEPSPSVLVTLCEGAADVTGGAGEQQEDVEAHPAQDVQPDNEAAAVDIRPSVEEKMEVGILTGQAQQVVELQVECVQETAGQQPEVAAEPEAEQLPKHTKMFSLLDSSDEEEDDDDDDEEEEEEREVSEEEERGEPSKSLDAAAASVDGLFVIDTRPGHHTDKQYYRVEGQMEEATTSKRVEQQEEEEEEFVDEEGDEEEEDEAANVLFSSRDPNLKALSSRIDAGIRVKELGGLYISFDGSKSNAVSSPLQKLKEKKLQDEVMKKSVIGPEFEKKDAVPPYSESKQALKLKRRAEREKSTGGGWFDMKAPEVTQELKGDLQVLKMRASLDPKRFYKKNDRDGFPKYFQVGTVVDNPVDFYHSRIPKKERKRTMVEELLADADFRHNNKKKFQRVIAEQAAMAGGKRHRKKKFHRK